MRPPRDPRAPSPSPTRPAASVDALADEIEAFARVLVSEASVGNRIERLSVGHTVLTRMRRNRATSVRGVWRAYAHHAEPTHALRRLAAELLDGLHEDPTQGATHYYSPRSMPAEGQDTKGFDVRGGLETIPGLATRRHRPGWSLHFEPCDVPGVRPSYFRFFRAAGVGPVR